MVDDLPGGAALTVPTKKYVGPVSTAPPGFLLFEAQGELL